MADSDTFNLDVAVNLGIEPVQEGMFASDEDKEGIKSYLTEEIESVLSGEERGKMVDKWAKWRRTSEGRPEKEKKTYPWDGASNVTVPITMTSTHGIFAMLKNIFGNREQFWKVDDVKKNFEQARVLETVLNTIGESKDHMNLRSNNNTVFYDLARMGTQFVKVPWITDSVSFKRRGAGGATETVQRTRKNSPAMIPIRLEDFLTRPYWYDIQRAPWIADRIPLMEHELLQRMQQGIYDEEAVETVLKAEPSELDDNQKADLKRQGIDISFTDTKMYDIFETYVFWDIDGDGIPEDLKLWLHKDTQEILRVEYNDLSIRPIIRIPFIHLPYQLYGLGTGWISESMQDEIDAIHNMRVDATHIAALQMYTRRKGSGGLSMAQEDFHPLKEIIVDEIGDFQPIKFPGVGYESIQAEMMAKEYNDRANQVPDSQMGFENRAIGTRATASGTKFLAAQNEKVSSALIENVEESYGDLGQMTAFQIVRNADKARVSIMPLLSEEDQVIFEEILSLNVEDIPTVFSFKVRTSDPGDTASAMIEQKMTLFQMYTMYGERMFQVAGIMENPQATPMMKEMAASLFVGGTKFMQEIFGHFKQRSADDFLPFIKDIEMMNAQMDAMKEQQLGAIRKSQSGVIEPGGGGTPDGNVQQQSVEGPSESGPPPSQADKIAETSRE